MNERDAHSMVGRFGLHIARLRQARGMGPVALARRAGIAPQSLYNIEAGSLSYLGPSLWTLQRLAHGLDLSLSEIMEGFE